MLTLPAEFRVTHQTAGLPGYPAVDVFAPAGTLTHMRCIAVEVGQLVRPGTVLGQVEHPPASMAASSAHVHLGDTGAVLA